MPPEPEQQISPEELEIEFDEEEPAPGESPAPVANPETLSEAHGYPRARRVQE